MSKGAFSVVVVEPRNGSGGDATSGGVGAPGGAAAVEVIVSTTCLRACNNNTAITPNTFHKFELAVPEDFRDG